MKNFPTILGGIALLIAVGALLLGFSNSAMKAVSQATPFGNTSIDGNQALLPNPSNTDYEVARLALGLGTNLSNSNTGAGNVVVEAQRVAMVAATTTPCAIQNPFNATSTVQDFVANITTATSTAVGFQIATSTTAFLNTSPVFGATLAANQQGTFMTGETASSTGLGVILPPTGWVTMTLTSANTIGGTCSAVFDSV